MTQRTDKLLFAVALAVAIASASMMTVTNPSDESASVGTQSHEQINFASREPLSIEQ